MKIGIIDADLIGRDKHRFPNLASMKISGYHKGKGDNVELLLNYNWDNTFDEIYISKVFTDTEVPEFVSNIVGHENDACNLHVHIGGTGFYFDKAPDMPDEIEHHMPDYHLYDEWIENTVLFARNEYEKNGRTFNESSYRVQFKEYTDYSIGFTTRGCFRKCPFCVNQKFDHVFGHSPISEFYDPTRKKICLLDDNILGYSKWAEVIDALKDTNKQFKFKQGIDERLLTEDRCEALFSSKYDSDYTFAFDNISDYKLIHKKLKMIRSYTDATNIKFYVLVGFESTDAKDIENAFKRIELLLNYRCLPYIMRYMSPTDAPWKRSKYHGMYVTLARWCNQPNMVKKMTFREFCEANQALHKTKGTLCVSMKSMVDFEKEYPEIASRYFDLRYGEKNTNIEV